MGARVDRLLCMTTTARKVCRRCRGTGHVPSPIDNGRCWACNREPAPSLAPVAPELVAKYEAYSRAQAQRRLAVIEAALADPTIQGKPAERARAEATIAQLRVEIEETR